MEWGQAFTNDIWEAKTVVGSKASKKLEVVNVNGLNAFHYYRPKDEIELFHLINLIILIEA